MNERTRCRWLLLSLLIFAQGSTPAAEPEATADPLVFDTWVPGPCSPNGQPQGQCPPGDLFRVRLVPVAEGLRSPRHIAFTPDGDLLITELAAPAGDPAAGTQSTQAKPGHVRIVRDGALAPEPVPGWPVANINAGALWSIVVDPQFASNRRVYLYYVKLGADEMLTRALARARFDGTSLVDVEEIFEADSWMPGGPMAGRAVFGPDGMLYLTVNDHVEHDGKNGGGEPLLAQLLDNDIGKVLRVRPDGGIVRRPSGRESGNLHFRPAQRHGLRLASRDRRAVDDGDRADGRRRDQHSQRRAQLRVAARVARQELQ
jgi:glucose/arabinose dehydrogenase